MGRQYETARDMDRIPLSGIHCERIHQALSIGRSQKKYPIKFIHLSARSENDILIEDDTILRS